MAAVVHLSRYLREPHRNSNRPGRPIRASRRGADPRSAPLLCLAGDELGARFHKWRARSGRVHVFSVFPVDAGERLGGLPEFESAIVLAVGFDSRERRRLTAFEMSWEDGRFVGDVAIVARALELGAHEWHVHLLAKGAAARRELLDDLTE